jgi:hypothetical protein
VWNDQCGKTKSKKVDTSVKTKEDTMTRVHQNEVSMSQRRREQITRLKVHMGKLVVAGYAAKRLKTAGAPANSKVK